MNRTRRRLIALFTLCMLLVGLVGSTALWLRALYRHYALNRQLIGERAGEGHLAHRQALNAMADRYRVYQPEDILCLDAGLPGASAGRCVLLSCRDVFGLAVLGEDENGLLFATSSQVSVPATDSADFRRSGWPSIR